MANKEHLKILKQGVAAWNKWREENPKDTPDLSGADLSKANLIRAGLIHATLSP
ncbi:MAG: pentapeptide repeat-containing protein, partial [Chloroflexi bacterium]|nr:pentapeptide repeat-containing protein [Chloroflexota bacterium]